MTFLHSMGKKYQFKLKFLHNSAKKKFEHFFKSITQGRGISCKPPSEYSQRFKDFIEEIFEGDQ